MTTRSLPVALVAVAVLFAGTSSAIAKPRVRLALPSAAEAQTAIAFSYRTAGLAPRNRVVLQRQQGTAHVWRTVIALKRVRVGFATLPGLGLGAYNFRIAALGRHRRVIAQQRRPLKVFGEVPFSKLFISGEQSAVTSRTVKPGAYTTPSRTFSYAVDTRANHGEVSTVISVGRNPCRAIHIDFVPGVRGSASAPRYQQSSATVSVVQESLDPVSSSASFNAFGALDASLVPGQSWSINTVAGGQFSIDLFLNGVASCYSEGPLLRPEP